MAIPLISGVSLLVGVAVQLLCNALGHPELEFLSVSTGLFAAAVVNWLVGVRLNTRPGRELIDANTGQRVVLRRTHRLFWIPMQYWSIPVALFGLASLLLIRHTP